ncbi:TIM-barrel protein [Ferroglobus placidus DSM 10642]|uniref:TIM-barrel protein n=2 Tax=Ferroglobus placidus TaxID=54261 RepID=D3S0G0_FERPA|nr:TIM-barrel protein [Ferroglobus placidus DSM 10642]
MAGINNSNFVKKFKVGLAVLGGFNADKKANEAALKSLKRGRREFVFENPLKEIEKELVSALDSYGKIAVNVRASSIDGYVSVAKICEEYDVLLEINAHCRQPEFMEIGAGQSLLFNQEKLLNIVEKCSKYCDVSVKIRGGLNLDYSSLSEKLFSSAFILHVDAMIPGGGADYNLIKEISAFGNVIGNNSVKDINTARKMIESGAKLVSLARAVIKNERIFDELLEDDILSLPIEVI